MKTVYSYNDSGFYIGEQQCQLDPVESAIKNEDVYLIPGNSTEEVPPELIPGYFLRFNGDSWEYLINPNSDAEFREKALSVKNQYGVSLKKVLDDGTIIDLTTDEINQLTLDAKLEIVRNHRAPLLAKIDIFINEIVLYELGSDVKLAVADYRQQLLDITSTITVDTDIYALQWPELPSSVSTSSEVLV